MLGTPLRPELQEILVAAILLDLELAIYRHFLAIFDEAPAACEMAKFRRRRVQGITKESGAAGDVFR